MRVRPVRRIRRALVVLAFLAVAGSAPGQPTHPVVHHLAVTGNLSVPAAQLQPLLSTRATSQLSWLPWVDKHHLDPDRLRADLLRLRAFYRDHGFFEVKVDTVLDRSRPGRVDVTYIVTEGPPTLVGRVDVIGSEVPERLHRSLGSIPGRRLSREDLEGDRLLLLEAARDSGYAFATVSAQSRIDQAIHKADVTYRIDFGPRYRFAAPRIEGNEGVTARTIERGLTFRPGQSFSSRKLRQSRRQLYLSGAFRSVVLNVPDSLVSDDDVSVVVRVSERSPRTIQIGAGYDTESQFQGLLAWTHRSAFGGGQQFTVSARGSAIENQASLSLRQPYVMGSRNWLSLRTFVTREERQEFRQIELGGNILFERNIRTRTTFFFDTSAGLIDFKADSAFTEFALGFRNDRRDDFLDPSNGLLVNLTLKEKGLLFGSDREFIELAGEGRFYRSLPGRLVLATKVLGGALFDLSEEGEIPNIERYFGGGLSSVRGWGFEELGPRDASGAVVGGKSRLEGSVELRARLGRYFGLVGFVDAGNVDSEFEAFNLGSLRWAIGSGLRYLSPVGPIRLDFARRLSEDLFASRHQFHLSLGQAF